MHLINAEQEAIKTDKEGTQYTEEFQIAYAIPSWYVHGEPVLIDEVFPALDDDTNWDFDDANTVVSALTALFSAVSYLLKFCDVTRRAYGLPNHLALVKSEYAKVRRGLGILRSHST